MKLKYQNKLYIRTDRQEYLHCYEFFVNLINNNIYDKNLMIVYKDEYAYLLSIAISLNNGYMPNWIISIDDINLDIKIRNNFKYIGLYKQLEIN